MIEPCWKWESTFTSFCRGGGGGTRACNGTRACGICIGCRGRRIGGGRLRVMGLCFHCPESEVGPRTVEPSP